MPIRTLKNNTINHVFNRGNSKIQIFKDSEDYLHFIAKMASLKRKMHISIYSYCIMPNHFHILLKEHNGKTTLYMRSLQISYSKYFNFKYKHSGHVFEGRYKNKILHDDFDFINVKSYIESNPIKDRLVDNISKWPYVSANTPI